VKAADAPARARRRRLTHDRRILLLAFLAGLPGTLLALLLLWLGVFELRTQLTLTILVVVLWCAFAFAARERVLRPLQSVANLLEALREGDFSLRGRGRGPDDPIEEVMREVNALADTLREQRLGALEAIALMRKVMEEIDVGVFAFDEEARLRLVNRAGERLLGRPAEQLLARPAADLGLDTCLAPGGGSRILDLAFAGGAGRFEVHAGTFRQGGEPHRLLVLTDLSRALRDEERQAWQRLIRVVGHELNNSLAPIRSIAGSLSSLLARNPPPADWKDDMRRGLLVIGSRAEALGRFMEGYARLARLPPPTLQPVALGALVRRVAGLETRLPVAVRAESEVTLLLDADQIEQLLINLIRNAVDAAEPSAGGVSVGWRPSGGAHPMVEIRVEDDGPGVPESANLFVPFFTTKPHGSGIGLVLCRQIAEAHGGHLTLENRRNARGCVARIRLPIQTARRDRSSPASTTG
jgi:nitrogen fixation/metabolism regulation signal transduction histidine kinase